MFKKNFFPLLLCLLSGNFEPTKNGVVAPVLPNQSNVSIKGLSTQFKLTLKLCNI